MTATSDQLEEITAPLAKAKLRLSFPGKAGLDQDEEWFEVEDETGAKRRLRVHDYAELYRTPGLYETLVYDALQCRSPEHVVQPLKDALAARKATMETLRVLDLGAGNGVVGELFRRNGAESVMAVDIIPEAAEAARRDRPEAYEDYLVADLAESDPDAERRLRDFAPNCLVTVAALGFGDIPPEAFAKAFNVIAKDGWLAMCIKERFLEEDDDSGFGLFLRRLVSQGTIEVLYRERYVHRVSIAEEKLHYVSLIARKNRNAPLTG